MLSVVIYDVELRAIFSFFHKCSFIKCLRVFCIAKPSELILSSNMLSLLNDEISLLYSKLSSMEAALEVISGRCMF